ncbi:hypothetical protein BJ875DRAFT_482614 [Amylocarpus encephaloides]|uniref:DUF6594 domain-containing protein n=1 Tax=Amylocarpus encephaloides TaxID=45428 RepID=A0A9P7YMB5_9HELO|nr:hypothetical protein BJ875DRAFT_482614 [Amylocarpus encephaloides]
MAGLRITTPTDEAAIHQNAMAQIQHPPIRDVEGLQEWMEVDSAHVYLVGKDRPVWEDPDHRDLLVMRARTHASLLSSLLSEILVDEIHRWIFYPLEKIKNRPWLNDIRHEAKTMWQRLVVVAGFTFAFLLVLGLGTNAALVEVLAASAAFAAVQVAFVGSADNDGSTNPVLSGLGTLGNAT